MMQEPPLTGSINVRAPRYLVAQVASACWHCHRDTLAIAIALAQDHEIWVEDPDASAAGRPPGVWQCAGMRAWIFYVEYLPLRVRRRLHAWSSAYRYAYNRQTDGSYWINHCQHCGCAQDDDYLHGEPDVAFLPLAPAAAERILVSAVEEPFAAWAGGYCCDPPLFDAMRMARQGGN